MADQYWTRVRFVTDTLIASDRPITEEDLVQASDNAGTAIRTTAFEGVKNVTVSFLEEHKMSVCHIHDAVDESCVYCRTHSRDELGPEYTN